MATFLFDDMVFGPVKSRRLGNSLGINLLPVDCKICNFDCIYCECGWTQNKKNTNLPSASEIKEKLNDRLSLFLQNKTPVDTITFAGNGEPTMHPEFERIVEETIQLRDKYFPKAKIAVLSNSTLLKKENVFRALKKVELNILKLDSALENTVKVLNRPASGFKLENVIEDLKKFKGKFILQTMFVKGTIGNEIIDNTILGEVNAWLGLVKILKPQLVMIYTISRDTPINTLEAIPEDKLREIAGKLKKSGFEVQVST